MKSSPDWIKDYLVKTVSHGTFKRFVSSATDMYVLAYSQNENKYFSGNRVAFLIRQLITHKTLSFSELSELQSMIGVKDERLRNLKRIVSHWDSAPTIEKHLVMQKIGKKIKDTLPKSEILPELKKVKI